MISKNLTVELRHSEAQASLLIESKASINGEGWVRKCIWCDMMKRRKVDILCEKEEGNQDQEHWRWIQAALLWYGYSRKRNVLAWCWSKSIWIVLCRWRGCRAGSPELQREVRGDFECCHCVCPTIWMSEQWKVSQRQLALCCGLSSFCCQRPEFYQQCTCAKHQNNAAGLWAHPAPVRRWL